MIFMVLPAWLLAMIPGLVGGFAKMKFSQDAVNRMNRYNDPRAQMQRMLSAGLPVSAMGSLSAGEQSQLPDVGGIGDNISNYFQSFLQMKQQEMLQGQIKGQGISNEMQGYLADIMGEEAAAGLEAGGFDTFGNARSNAFMSKAAEYEMKQVGLKVQKNQERISSVEADLKERLAESGYFDKEAKAKLDSLLVELDIKGLQENNMKAQTIARDTILKRMSRNGISLGEAILLQVMNSLSGGVSFGGGRIGF